MILKPKREKEKMADRDRVAVKADEIRKFNKAELAEWLEENDIPRVFCEKLESKLFIIYLYFQLFVFCVLFLCMVVSRYIANPWLYSRYFLVKGNGALNLSDVRYCYPRTFP